MRRWESQTHARLDFGIVAPLGGARQALLGSGVSFGIRRRRGTTVGVAQLPSPIWSRLVTLDRLRSRLYVR